MISRTVNAKDLPKLLAHTRKVIKKAHQRAILESVAVGAELVATRVPVDTGRLKQSVRLRRKGKSGFPEIVADAPYAGVIEAGSRPHWAPLRPLLGWVKRKVGREARAMGIRVPSRVGVYRGRSAAAWRRYNRRSKLRGDFVDAVLKTARLVQRKIATKGTRAHWFMKRSLPDLRRILGTLHSKAHDKALRDLGNGGGGSGGTP